MAQLNPASPHAPKVGRTGRLLGRFHVTGVFWYRFHEWGVRTCPDVLLGFFMTLFITFFFLSLVRIRRAVATNLEVAIGPCGFVERQRRIWRTFREFAWCQTERYERLAIERRFVFDAEDDGALAPLVRSDEGWVFVTSHIGNWEVGSAAPADRDERRVHVVREEERDPRAQDFIRELLRRRMGERYTTHFVSQDNPGLGMALLEALRHGDVVALQGDRPRRSGSKTVKVTLFGRPYELPAGPLALARAAEVPLLPAFILREGRLHYRAAIHAPIRVANTGDRSADLQAAADKLIGSIEWAIREKPHQWFCFRELWNA